jgi:DMSO/TMAO reductase YedYZ heme-binding membrane subunit
MNVLWYATRGTGLVAMLFLTVVFALGMLTAVRVGGSSVPRFVLAGLHRSLTLAGLGFLAVHIGTAVADSYAPIDLVAAVVPLASAYRPIWLGFGALSFDALLVLTATSLLRPRLGHRTWRILHWTAYACWPLLVVHALGTGTDTRTSAFLLIAGFCGALALVAGGWRLLAGDPAHRARRAGAAAFALAAVAVIAVWTVQGPLAPGWAARSGTPPISRTSGGGR